MRSLGIRRKAHTTTLVLGVACSLVALCSLVGCTGPEGSPDAGPRPEAIGARQAAAITLVAGARPVRWVSRRELCIVPYDELDLEACRSRGRRSLPPEVYQRIRRAVPGSAGDANFIACVEVSREIPIRDSTLVVVGTVGGVVADGFVESAGHWVWFRPRGRATRDSVWVTRDPEVLSSDVEPMRDSSRC